MSRVAGPTSRADRGPPSPQLSSLVCWFSIIVSQHEGRHRCLNSAAKNRCAPRSAVCFLECEPHSADGYTSIELVARHHCVLGLISHISASAYQPLDPYRTADLNIVTWPLHSERQNRSYACMTEMLPTVHDWSFPPGFTTLIPGPTRSICLRS